MGCVATCIRGCGKSGLGTFLGLNRDPADQGGGHEDEDRPKQYSWDKKRQEVDLSKFTFDGLNGVEAGRCPGQINGEQIVIRNCKDSSIYLFDHINTVTIDDCSGCKFFIGPTKGSVFIRDSSDCVLALACGQFRARDCIKLDVFMSCATQPIIEATAKIRFSCLQFHYPALEEHFAKADLNPFTNFWWLVHDFTPLPTGQKNWSLLAKYYTVSDFLPLPQIQPDLIEVGATSEAAESVVPLTVGPWRSHGLSNPEEETAFVLIGFDDKQVEKSKRLVKAMVYEGNGEGTVERVEVLSSFNIKLEGYAEQFFGQSPDLIKANYATTVSEGPVTGLHEPTSQKGG